MEESQEFTLDQFILKQLNQEEQFSWQDFQSTRLAQIIQKTIQIQQEDLNHLNFSEIIANIFLPTFDEMNLGSNDGSSLIEVTNHDLYRNVEQLYKNICGYDQDDENTDDEDDEELGHIFEITQTLIEVYHLISLKLNQKAMLLHFKLPQLQFFSNLVLIIDQAGTIGPIKQSKQKPQQIKPFKLRSDQEQKDALLDETANCEIFQKIVPLYEDVPPLTRGSWLASHPEKGQSYSNYIKSQAVNKFGEKGRDQIYILPFQDEFTQEDLEQIKEYCEIFYLNSKVVIMSADKLASQIKFRKNGLTGNTQYHAGDIINQMKDSVPEDAYCVIGILMTDLYPDEQWNFVFGMATLSARVGVFSFARYDDRFFNPSLPKDQNRIIHRAIQVMVHQIGHMFGMKHCIFYSCVLNGSNSSQESDRHPIYECPICLRKLVFNLGFDPVKRYARLIEFGEKHKGYFQKEIEFYKLIIEMLQSKE